MKNIFIILSLILSLSGFGQLQNVVQINETWTKENPAYSGIQKLRNTGVLYKYTSNENISSNQYTNLYFNTPIRFNSMGIGLNFAKESSSLSTSILALNYNYRIRVLSGLLSFGLQGNYIEIKPNTDNFNIRHPDDVLIDHYSPNSFFDLGAGLFYASKTRFLSLGIKNLLHNELNNEIHIAFGSEFYKTNFFSLRYQIFGKHVDSNPLFVNMLVRFLLKDIGEIGIGYTHRASYNIQTKWRINKIIPGIGEKIVLGYSYENPYKRNTYLAGSTNELLIRYDFGKRYNTKKIDPKRVIVSPTFFD